MQIKTVASSWGPDPASAFNKPVEWLPEKNLLKYGICSHKEFIKLDNLISQQMKGLEEPFVSLDFYKGVWLLEISHPLKFICCSSRYDFG